MRSDVRWFLTLYALFAIALIFVPLGVEAQSSELAGTPPMGWNSWNHFKEKVTAADVRAAADARRVLMQANE